MDEQRLDKWLWCTRFYKTRGMAAQDVKQGRVSVNGIRAKPARLVHVSDNIVLRRPPYEFHLQIVGISKQRVSASKTAELFVETDESQAKRASLAQSINNSAVSDDTRYGKLSKKDRREREKLKRSL